MQVGLFLLPFHLSYIEQAERRNGNGGAASKDMQVVFPSPLWGVEFNAEHAALSGAFNIASHHNEQIHKHFQPFTRHPSPSWQRK